MAKLALIYGMRLLPEEDLGEVKDATVVLKNGRTARVTMHLIEGSKEEMDLKLGEKPSGCRSSPDRRWDRRDYR